MSAKMGVNAFWISELEGSAITSTNPDTVRTWKSEFAHS